MGIFDTLKGKTAEYFDKRNEDKEFEDRPRKEAEMNQRLIYEQEYKKAALKASIIRAKQEAEKKTGYAKLKALDMAERLGQPRKPGMMSRLHEYTQANLARGDANIQRTAKLKEAIRQQETERQMKNKSKSYQPIVNKRLPSPTINRPIRPPYKPFSDLRGGLKY